MRRFKILLYLQSGANPQSPDAVPGKCKPLATERVRVEQVNGKVRDSPRWRSNTDVQAWGAYLVRNGQVIGQWGSSER